MPDSFLDYMVPSPPNFQRPFRPYNNKPEQRLRLFRIQEMPIDACNTFCGIQKTLSFRNAPFQLVARRPANVEAVCLVYVFFYFVVFVKI